MKFRTFSTLLYINKGLKALLESTGQEKDKIFILFLFFLALGIRRVNTCKELKKSEVFFMMKTVSEKSVFRQFHPTLTDYLNITCCKTSCPIWFSVISLKIKNKNNVMLHLHWTRKSVLKQQLPVKIYVNTNMCIYTHIYIYICVYVWFKVPHSEILRSRIATLKHAVILRS